MSRRWTVLLALASLAIAAYLFGWELPRERNALERGEEARLLLPFAETEADTLRIERDGRVVLLARDAEETWWLREPRVEKASPLALKNQLGVLSRALSVRRLDESLPPDEFERYGLAPQQRIAVRVASREGWARTLFVGNLSPGEEFAYVRRPEGADLELAETAIYQIAWSRADTYRDTRLFEIERADVVRIEVDGPRGRWAAEIDEQGLWFSEDRRHRFDRETLQGIAYDLATARIRGFERDGMREGDWAAYGLAEPYASIAFSVRDGGAHLLQFGNEAAEGNVFARRDRGDTVLQLLPQLVTRAELDPRTLVDTNPIVRNFTQLDSLRVRWEEDGTEYRLRWIDDTWRVGMRGEWPGGDDERLMATRNVIEALEGFQVDDTLILAAGQRAGDVLDRLPITVRLWWKDEPVDLRVGWRGHGEHHWVQVDDESQLHRTGRELFLALRGFFLSARLLTP